MIHDRLGLFTVLAGKLHQLIDRPDMFLHQLRRIDSQLIEQLLEPVGDHDQRDTDKYPPQSKIDAELAIMDEDQIDHCQHDGR